MLFDEAVLFHDQQWKKANAAVSAAYYLRIVATMYLRPAPDAAATETSAEPTFAMPWPLTAAVTRLAHRVPACVPPPPPAPPPPTAKPTPPKHDHHHKHHKDRDPQFPGHASTGALQSIHNASAKS